MKFKSSVYTQVSGSVGGLTYAHNQGGMYARARSIPTNPQTSLQTTVRNALASLISRWSLTLDAAQRAAWALYAANVPTVDQFGDPRTLTGPQVYVSCNVPRLQAGLTVVDDGPTTFTLPYPGPSTLFAADATGDTLDITVDDDDAWLSEDGAAMLVYQGYPQQSVKNFYKAPYRYAGKIAGNATTPPTGEQSIAAAFPFVADDAIFIYTRITRADGRLSTRWSFRTLGS